MDLRAISPAQAKYSEHAPAAIEATRPRRRDGCTFHGRCSLKLYVPSRQRALAHGGRPRSLNGPMHAMSARIDVGVRSTWDRRARFRDGSSIRYPCRRRGDRQEGPAPRCPESASHTPKPTEPNEQKGGDGMNQAGTAFR
jgi:hypothetical protein